MTDPSSQLRRPMSLYLASYVLSLTGSVFGAVAVFLSLEGTFGTLEHLSLALALKTLFVGVLSPLLVKLMRKLGLWRLLIWSQLLGAALTFLLILAFESQSYPFTLVVIVLGGIPNSAVSLANPVLFRSTLDDGSFRSFQGRLSLISSFILLAAGLTAQLALFEFGLTAILLYDAATFLVAFLVFYFAGRAFQRTKPFQDVPPEADSLWAVYRKSFAANGALTIYLLIGSVYLFKGLYPLISGSVNPTFSEIFPDFLRRSVWSLEALAGIAGSLLYLRLTKSSHSQLLPYPAAICSLFLVPYLLIPHPVILLFGLFLLGLTMQLGFQQARDTFLLGAKTRANLEERSATISAASNLMMTLSPLILAGVMALNDFASFVGVALALQLTLVAGYALCRQKLIAGN